jgi:1-acyl-sn-glycerol-3-phosphate acyltransferase
MRNIAPALMPNPLLSTLLLPLNRLRHLLRAALHLLPWLLQLCIANSLLSLLLPLSLISRTATYNASSLIAASVWAHIQRIFTKTNKAHIIVTGDALPSGESAIVVCNHVEWSDFYMIQELALRAGMLGRCRWFAKKELKWVPFLGWGLWAMGMPLVSRKWMEDRKELDKVFSGVVEEGWPICRSFVVSFRFVGIRLYQYHMHAQDPGHARQTHTRRFLLLTHLTPAHLPMMPYLPSLFCLLPSISTSNYITPHELSSLTLSTATGLISFSESTRLTPAKRLAAASYALKHSKPLPNHLLLPRTKGFAASVQHLRSAPHVKAVYDLTLAYADTELEKSSKSKRESFTFQSPPTFVQSVLYPDVGRRWKTLVHVRRFELRDLPEEEDGLRTWLEERWIEKGELLEELRGKLLRGESWDELEKDEAE